VSQAVKKAALRKFFHSPAFNVVDGLDDYDDDFRNFEALGDIITSDMRSQMDREAERARQEGAEQAEGSPPQVAGDVPPEEVAETQDADQAVAAEEADDALARDEQEQSGEQIGGHQALAADDSDSGGVTREPGTQSRGPGKLRPRGAADKNT
jgi:hypothetical protein